MGDIHDDLREVMGLLAVMPSQELTVYDANEGDGWPPRPLWSLKNAAYDAGAEDDVVQLSLNFGHKNDADTLAACFNFLRQHGPALLARQEGEDDAARLDWLCSGRQKKVERTLSDGWYRVYQDMASIMDPEDWHAMTDQFYPTAREAIDAAMKAARSGGGG